MSTLLIRALVALLFALLSCKAAAQLRPGDIDRAFGNQGWTRLPFDRAGESPFDSARVVRVRSEPTQVGGIFLPFRYIYVAGIAGDRAAIVKLDANGALVTGFGTNGRVVSTQGEIGSLAGLEFAPNGDVVIGYSTRSIDTAARPGGEDFYVEVFTRDGQPRTQQTVFAGLPPLVQPVNWVGVGIASAAADEVACGPPEVTLTVGADSMAASASGELAVAGHLEYDGAPGGTLFRVGYAATARFQFDAGAGVYRRSPFTRDERLCGGGEGSSTVRMRSALGYYWNLRVPSATYLASGDLRAAYTGRGWAGDSGAAPVATHGGYIAMPAFDSIVQSASAAAPGSGYWSPDSRETEFTSIAWVPSRPNLFTYGGAVADFFPGGNRYAPIIASDNGTTALAPRWFFLNALLSTRSAAVRRGLYWEGKHILLGALRLCAAGNNCGGAFDSFFVAVTGGEPDNFAYPPSQTFGFQGSLPYEVETAPGVTADRAFALDGVVLEPDTVGGLPNSGARHLIVVGDFRRSSAANPLDFDWFVTRIRLRGAAGTVNVTKAGSGSGVVTSGPAGIDCGGTCSATFEPDVEVTLTAVPNAGSTFTGWSGACITPGQPTCRVRIDGDRNVQATFAGAVGDVIFSNGFE